jgi:hypothetical protein
MKERTAIKSLVALLGAASLLGFTSSNAQSVTLDPAQLDANRVFVRAVTVDGRHAMKIVKDPAVKEFDEPTFARIRGLEFANGTIEVKVRSRLLKDAPDFARGFIGVAFPIGQNNTRFERIYLHPTNARAEDQVRRNHSIQYFAYPDYKFQRLRKESPEAYESYADMALDEWITMKIVVRGRAAKLYLNGQQQPSLLVNDLKARTPPAPLGCGLT